MINRGGSQPVNGELIQELCLARGWWAKELAEASGLSIRKCQQLLNGGDAKIETINCIAVVFAYGVEELFANPVASPKSAKATIPYPALNDPEPRPFSFTLQFTGYSSLEQVRKIAQLHALVIQEMDAIGIPLASAESSLAMIDPEKENGFILLQGMNPTGARIYTYLAISLKNADRLLTALKSGTTFVASEFGEVLLCGEGEPAPDIREMMARKYGVAHLDKPVEFNKISDQ